MQIAIEAIGHTEIGSYFTVSGPKKTAQVAITKHGVQVVCCNAMHRVWRGMGRRFNNKAEALAGYKSSEMHALIETAFDNLPAKAA